MDRHGDGSGHITPVPSTIAWMMSMAGGGFAFGGITFRPTRDVARRCGVCWAGEGCDVAPRGGQWQPTTVRDLLSREAGG